MYIMNKRTKIHWIHLHFIVNLGKLMRLYYGREQYVIT